MHAQTHTILVTLKEGKFDTTHKYEGKDFIHYQTHNLRCSSVTLCCPYIYILEYRDYTFDTLILCSYVATVE